MFLTHLTCTACAQQYDWKHLQNVCPECQKPLFPTYDMIEAGRAITRDTFSNRRDHSLWRYRELLPLPADIEPVTLGEGGTPLLRLTRFSRGLGLSDVWVKDESVNPTQSFKARGMSVAVSMAKLLGAA